MKIQSLTLRNYKRFVESLSIDFTDPTTGKPMDMVLLVANNGNGKSSILQAIAAMVGSAVKYNFDPSQLDWPGFNYSLLQYYQPDFKVRANIVFTQAELDATQEFSRKVATQRDLSFIQPGNATQVCLLWSSDGVRADASSRSNPTDIELRRQLYQFKGHQYAMQLSNTPDFLTLFERIGTIVWFDEQRNVNKSVASFNAENAVDKLSNIRKLLADWSNFHVRTQLPGFEFREGQHDFFARLNNLYQQLFPSRELEGAAPNMNPVSMFEGGESEFWIKEINSNLRYELSEISGAERAILPILLTFARWNINNSIVLIDEAELHLHAPLQRAFVKMLPLLGKNNQFIITTHSDEVASLFQKHQIKRAPLWQ